MSIYIVVIDDESIPPEEFDVIEDAVRYCINNDVDSFFERAGFFSDDPVGVWYVEETVDSYEVRFKVWEQAKKEFDVCTCGKCESEKLRKLS